jgi:hypothetical protein
VSKRAVAAAVCTLLAFTAATLWVPLGWHDRTYTLDSWDALRDRHARGVRPLFAYGPWTPRALPAYRWVHYDWVWNQQEFQQDGLWATDVPRPMTLAIRPMWTWVLLTQGLVLVLGGGILTAVIRRERRRKAALLGSPGGD